MYALLLYSLKAGICLAVFYLFFKLLLSRETLHRFNRIFVLAGMVLAFVLPLCVITVYRELPAVPQIMFSGEAPQPAVVPAASGFDWERFAGALYLAGAVGMLGWLVRLFCAIFRLIRSGRRERLESGALLVRVRQAVTPFSWGRYIVVSEEDMAAAGREIVLHEEAHRRLHHSADLLLTDLAGLLQWFNPAMWLLRRELRAIHEYEADRAVIESGIDARDYQLLLIKKAVGGRWYSVANSFNHSKLKNRITMMLRKKSSRWTGARALLVLPLAAIAVGAFARTAYVVSDDKVNKESVTVDLSDPDFSTEKIDEVVVRYGRNSVPSESAPLYIVDGQEVDAGYLNGLDPDRIASVDIYKDAEHLAPYGERGRNGVAVITLKKGADSPKKTYVADTVVVVGYGSQMKGQLEAMKKAQAYFDSDEWKAKEKELAKIDEYFRSDEWKEAQKKIAAADKYFESDEWKEAQRKIAETSSRFSGISVGSAGEHGFKPLYRVDGIQVDNLDGIETGQIAHIMVRKDASAFTEEQKRQGYNSLIEVTTKAAAAVAPAGRIVSIRADRYAEHPEGSEVTEATGRITVVDAGTVYRDFLIFINGRRATPEELADIPAGKIRRMTVYKGAKAVEKFGEEARSGAVDVQAKVRRK